MLLPGSRLMEIQKMLPTLLDAAKLIFEKEPDIDFAMPRASTIPKEMLEGMIEKSGLKVKIVEGHIYDVMSVADLALATSGTVTLEAALCGLGCVIVYKTSPISAFIARRLLIYLISGCRTLLQAGIFCRSYCRRTLRLKKRRRKHCIFWNLNAMRR